MNDIVAVYTSCLNLDGYGDFVRCIDCGELMLMRLGDTVCRRCGSENLQWADEEHQECSTADLERMGFVVKEI